MPICEIFIREELTRYPFKIWVMLHIKLSMVLILNETVVRMKLMLLI